MSRVADDYFHLVIAPTHGHHFVDVEFDATAPEQIVEFIKALPFLPNLRTINLTRKLHDGIGRLDAPLQQAVEERLDRVIGTGIRDLTLDRLPLADIFRFTTRAPNVTRLSLFITNPSVIDELWSIISPIPHLAKLSHPRPCPTSDPQSVRTCGLAIANARGRHLGPPASTANVDSPLSSCRPGSIVGLV